jgi:hypothetical protein
VIIDVNDWRLNFENWVRMVPTHNLLALFLDLVSRQISRLRAQVHIMTSVFSIWDYGVAGVNLLHNYVWKLSELTSFPRSLRLYVLASKESYDFLLRNVGVNVQKE